MNTEFTQVFELALSEKLHLLEDLGDSIASDPDQIPVLDWQKEELAKRKAAYLQNPAQVVHGKTQRSEFVVNSMVLRKLMIPLFSKSRELA